VHLRIRGVRGTNLQCWDKRGLVTCKNNYQLWSSITGNLFRCCCCCSVLVFVVVAADGGFESNLIQSGSSWQDDSERNRNGGRLCCLSCRQRNREESIRVELIVASRPSRRVASNRGIGIGAIDDRSLRRGSCVCFVLLYFASFPFRYFPSLSFHGIGGNNSGPSSPSSPKIRTVSGGSTPSRGPTRVAAESGK